MAEDQEGDLGWRVMRGAAAGLPSFSTVAAGRAGATLGLGHVVAGGPGPMACCHSPSHAGAQDHLRGRCRIGVRAGRASRAGMVMIRRRRVAPRATR